MKSRWALIVSDFRREYHMSSSELARIDALEFRWLMQGLSSKSAFRQAWTDEPKHVYDPDEIDAVRNAARR